MKDKSPSPKEPIEKTTLWLVPLLLISATLFLFVFFYSEKSRSVSRAADPSGSKMDSLFANYLQNGRKNDTAVKEKYTQAARLLLAKDNALQSRKLLTLEEKIAALEGTYQNQLQTDEKALYQKEQDLKIEKARADELDKTIFALLDSLEAHKSAKELGQEKMFQQMEAERQKFSAESSLLKETIAQLEEAQKTSLEDNTVLDKSLNEAKSQLARTNELHEALLALQSSLFEEKTLARESEAFEHFQKVLADIGTRNQEEKNSLQQELSFLEEKLKENNKRSEMELAISEERFQEEKEKNEREYSLALSEVETKNEGLAIQLKVLEKELDETRLFNQSLEEKLEQASHSLAQSSEELLQMTSLSQELKDRLQKEGLTKEELAKQLEEASDKVSLIEQEMEKRSNAEALLAENIEKVTTLEDEKNELTSAITALKEREKQLNEELHNEVAQSTSVREELLKLSQSDEAVEEIALLLQAAREREERLTQKLDTVLAESARLADLKESIESEQASLKETLIKRESDLIQTEDKVKTLSLIVETLKKELNEKQGLHLDAEHKRSFSEFTFRQKITELERAIEEIGALQKESP